jgi:glyoxylase-like metal-dependent hydrolase (beta-lactamase superfamily II)
MSQTFQFRLGKLDCFVLNDGDSDSGTVEMLFANAPDELLKEALKRYRLDPNKISYSNNCMVIMSEAQPILIDTGIGTGKLFEGLDAIGLKPEDFKTVLLTHCHNDHSGGSVDESGKPRFPNAKYYLSGAEWEYVFHYYDHGRKLLETLGEQFETIYGSMEIGPGIKMMPAPGHSPGHMIVAVQSENDELYYTSDLFVHPLHIEFPDWNMSHETDFKQAAETRRMILGKAFEDDILIHAFHISFPGLGKIAKGERGWMWVEEKYADK